jgi:hypothetical protein
LAQNTFPAPARHQLHHQRTKERRKSESDKKSDKESEGRSEETYHTGGSGAVATKSINDEYEYI